jgi:hypothetical protein
VGLLSLHAATVEFGTQTEDYVQFYLCICLHHTCYKNILSVVETRIKKCSSRVGESVAGFYRIFFLQNDLVITVAINK